MVVSIPRLRRPNREDLPDRRSKLTGRIKLPAIEMPQVPDRAELIRRIKLPEVNLPDLNLPELNFPSVNLPQVDLPDLADIAALSDRLRGRQRRTADRTATWTRAGLALGVALSGIIGAAIAYFFDPDRGHERRIQTADRLAGLGRRATRRVGRLARDTTSTVGALGERLSRRTSDQQMGDQSGAAEPAIEMGDGMGASSDELVPSNPGH